MKARGRFRRSPDSINLIFRVSVATPVRGMAQAVRGTISGFLVALVTGVFLLHALGQTAHAGPLVELNSRPVAPDFELEDISGKSHRLSEMKGSVVLVNFWATWCPPCRAEMPSLERLKTKLDDPDFEIVAVNIGERIEDISRFYHSLNPPLTFTVLMDKDMQASQFWPMKGLPMTFLIDKEGRVTHVSQGARRWDTKEVKEVIQAIGQESAADDNAGVGVAIETGLAPTTDS